MTRTLRLAHRGDSRSAPENTLGALQAALRLASCDGVEFDVRASADGVPVLLHDETLLRVQRCAARVDSLTAAELGPLGLPTLEDVLQAVDRSVFLDIELKGRLGPNAVEVIDRHRSRDGRLEHAVVSSFVPETLEEVRAARPHWDLWLNAWDLQEATLARAASIGCRAIAAEWHAIDEESIALAARFGLHVAAFTVRERATFDRLARVGVIAACVEADALDG